MTALFSKRRTGCRKVPYKIYRSPVWAALSFSLLLSAGSFVLWPMAEAQAGFRWTPQTTQDAGPMVTGTPVPSLPQEKVPHVPDTPSMMPAPTPLPLPTAMEPVAFPSSQTGALPVAPVEQYALPTPTAPDASPLGSATRAEGIPARPPKGTPLALAPTPPLSMPALQSPPEEGSSSLPEDEILNGFGKDIPLLFALKQIIPESYVLSIAPDIDQDTVLSWSGGKRWSSVLHDALGDRGLAYTVEGQVMRIHHRSTETPVMPMPALTVAGPDAVPASSVPLPSLGTPKDGQAIQMGSMVPRPSFPRETKEPEYNTGRISDQETILWDTAPLPTMPALPAPVPAPLAAPTVGDAPYRQLSAIQTRADIARQNSPMRPGEIVPQPALPQETPSPAYNTLKPLASAETVMWQPARTPSTTVPAVAMAATLPAPTPLAPTTTLAPAALNTAIMPATLPEPLPLRDVPQIVAVPPTAIADIPVVLPPQSPAQTMNQSWYGEEGQSLHYVLEHWSNMVGTQLFWKAPRDYQLPETVSLRGDYTSAVESLLDHFNLSEGSQKRPVGKLYRQPAGPTILVIESAS